MSSFEEYYTFEEMWNKGLLEEVFIDFEVYYKHKETGAIYDTYGNEIDNDGTTFFIC